MSARLRLPRMLLQSVKQGGLEFEVQGSTLGEALGDLFVKEPGLRNHLVDEEGSIRPHVSIFVDGHQATLGTPLAAGADIRVLHAVSGGAP